MSSNVLNSARIRARMSELDMTFDVLAAKISDIRGKPYGRSQLSRTLGGHTNPGADIVQALTVALQIPADEVLSLSTVRVIEAPNG